MSIMRFSEAIHLGSMLGRQIYGDLENSNGDTCALGAARKALGVKLFEAMRVFYMKRNSRCPECSFLHPTSPDAHFSGHHDYPILAISTHLNDFHKWTREAIADWLEAEEVKMGIGQRSPRLLESELRAVVKKPLCQK